MVTMAGAGLFSSSGGASSLNGKGTLACPIAEAGACPVFLPTKEEFEQPFGEFVSKVGDAHVVVLTDRLDACMVMSCA